MRAAVAPIAAGAVTLGALTLWTWTGAAGHPARVQVENAWVMAPTSTRTGAYFSITNRGDAPDELLRIRTPISATAMLSRQVNQGGAGRMEMVYGLPVPAHRTIRMTPYTMNVMIRPTGSLPAGRRVPFTLVFRHSGTVHTTAVVTPPGGAGPR